MGFCLSYSRGRNWPICLSLMLYAICGFCFALVVSWVSWTSWREKDRDEARSMSLECVNRGRNLPIIFRQKQLIFRSLEESKSEEVIIRRRKGDMFSNTPESPRRRSPFDVPGLRKGITPKEILEAIREFRERASRITTDGVNATADLYVTPLFQSKINSSWRRSISKLSRRKRYPLILTLFSCLNGLQIL